MLQEIKMPDFKTRLNELFIEYCGTAVAFADFLGTSRQTLGYYLNGQRIPDAKTIKKICERCNVSSDWLLGLSDTRKPDASAQAVNEYTGLSEAAIESIRAIKEEGFNSMEPLNKALASKALLNSLSAIMSTHSAERGYHFGACSPENGFYQVEMSPDSFALILEQSLLNIVEAIRTGNYEAVQPYPPYERRLSETIEKLRAEGRLTE